MTQNNTIFLILAHYTKAPSFFLPSSSRCATQLGPTEQTRAGVCGRTGRVRGRLRTDRAGAYAGTGWARAHAQTNIQNNSFIIPFISIHLLNNFSSLYILLPSYSRYLLTDSNTPSPTCAFCNNFLFSWVDTFGLPIFLTVS